MQMAKLGRTLFGLLVILISIMVLPVQAYDVERNSSGNRVYMLLMNDNPGAVYHTIEITQSVPSFVNSVTASIVPTSVLGGSSDLVAVDFNVPANASVGSTGDLVITVSGTAAGSPIDVVFTVPLEVVNTAAAVQGYVGVGEPTPNPGGTDTDGDGVPDSLEVEYGSDPNSASSLPGQVDTDGDGLNDGDDSAPNDPCLPSAFNRACTQDTDGDGESDNDEGELADADADGTPDYQESSILDDDNDGVVNELDATNTNPCLPSAFNSACTQDTDGDGETDNDEGELTDTDSDGTPDYQESSILDSDSDGISDELDAANANACIPSAFNSACTQDTDGDGETDNDEGVATDTDGDGTPDYQESSILDDDNDGVSNELDATNADPCQPSAFNSACTQDTDGDGETDNDEGELTDTDSDGTPDYQESSILDSDNDGVSDELDADNADPCVPDAMASNCASSDVNVPVFGPTAYLLFGLILSALGITQMRRLRKK